MSSKATLDEFFTLLLALVVAIVSIIFLTRVGQENEKAIEREAQFTRERIGNARTIADCIAISAEGFNDMVIRPDMFAELPAKETRSDQWLKALSDAVQKATLKAATIEIYCLKELDKAKKVPRREIANHLNKFYKITLPPVPDRH